MCVFFSLYNSESTVIWSNGMFYHSETFILRILCPYILLSHLSFYRLFYLCAHDKKSFDWQKNRYKKVWWKRRRMKIPIIQWKFRLRFHWQPIYRWETNWSPNDFVTIKQTKKKRQITIINNILNTCRKNGSNIRGLMYMYHDKRRDKFTKWWNSVSGTHRTYDICMVMCALKRWIRSIDIWISEEITDWIQTIFFLLFDWPAALIFSGWFSHSNDLRNAYMIFLFVGIRHSNKCWRTKNDKNKTIKAFLKSTWICNSINSFFHIIFPVVRFSIFPQFFFHVPRNSENE